MKFESLDANARDLYVAAMSWMEEHWDQAAGLLWDDGESKLAGPHHVIRGSVWYVFGLLMRNGPGDNARAVRVIELILRFQFNTPGCRFHGTFLRAPEEPYPPADVVIWRDYDPNWREFIGTAFALILLEFTDRLPGSLVQKIDEAMHKAVVGALSRGLSASYTNIALMYAFMLCFSGKRFDEPIWFVGGERMARHVYRIFKQQNAFTEYN